MVLLSLHILTLMANTVIALITNSDNRLHTPMYFFLIQLSCWDIFSTCSSQLLVVTVFYGAAGSMYLRPKYSYCASVDKFVSLSYSLVTPLLNPIICSLRNKEVKGMKKQLVYMGDDACE
ncbi:olfactory receptor 2G6-like [Cinclus cinclus]|uniref:olfactory receptor 2G6-like n=1 Tax=Cinclus cinclus TaxID=127875 RepID=UPI002E0FF445